MQQRKIDDKKNKDVGYVKLGHGFTSIPGYGYVFALLIFFLNHIFYMPGRAIGEQMARIYGGGPFGTPSILEPSNPDCGRGLGGTPKTAVDNMFPLVIEFGIIPYISYSIFLTFEALVIAHTGRNRFTQFVLACFASGFIGFLILAFAPTTMNRHAEGVIDRMNQSDIGANIYRNCILIESEPINGNLAPSFHCITTGLVMFACFNKKGINIGLQSFSFVGSILIFFSTLYTKQHYFIDFVLAMAIIVPTYLLFTHFRVGEVIWNKHPKGAKILDRTIPDIYHLAKKRKESK